MEELSLFKASHLALVGQVRTCAPNTTLSEVVAILQSCDIGSVVISENNFPVGIFTERDFIKKIAGTKVDLEQELVSKFMTPNPVCVPDNTSLRIILGHMRVGRFRHVIIVNSERKLQSVVSVKDVLNFMIDCNPT